MYQHRDTALNLTKFSRTIEVVYRDQKYKNIEILKIAFYNFPVLYIYIYIYVTGPAKIDYVSANYNELYFR